jgi:hypothetical protein
MKESHVHNQVGEHLATLGAGRISHADQKYLLCFAPSIVLPYLAPQDRHYGLVVQEVTGARGTCARRWGAASSGKAVYLLCKAV